MNEVGGEEKGVASAPGTKRQPAGLWLAVLLFFVTVVLFYRATSGGFLVYDDSTFVTKNPHVNTGLTRDNVAHAFFGMDTVDWEPLSTLTHILDCQVFGLKPWGHHLVNVLIHAFNTAGLFWLLLRLTRATGCSLVVAALFGLHPLRVESVAWVAERKDVLCLSFWLLATWAYVRYVEAGSAPVARWRYRLCVFLFALGLLAKPMMVTFPFFLLLLDYWPLRRIADGGPLANWKIVIFDKIPLLLLTVADCAATYFLQKQYGAVETALSFSVRAENALMSYARYLGKLAWPTDLAVLYPRSDHWTTLQLLFAGALITGVTLAAILFRKRAPWLTVGWFWYLGTLVPVIGLVQAGEQSMADRYTYIPMIGVAIILVWGARELVDIGTHSLFSLSSPKGLSRRSEAKAEGEGRGEEALTAFGTRPPSPPKSTRRWQPILWTLPLLALFCVYATLTWKQLGYWQDNLSLFEHTVQVTQSNYVADSILADIYHSHGDMEKATGLLKDALGASPNFPPAVEMTKAWRFEQDILQGRQALHAGQSDLALNYFTEANQLNPNHAEVHYSLGVIDQNQGRLDVAVTEFQVTLYLKPDSYQARRHLAFTYVDAGKVADASREFAQAVKDHPDSFDAHTDLAQALAIAGKRDESIAELKLALQIRPGDPAATSHLAEMEAAEKR